MDHDDLIRRALTWLRSQQHPLVLSGIASCDEIPDAIGFATSRSTVIEVKTSRSDFHRDRAKYKVLVHPDGRRCSLKAPLKYRKLFEGCQIELSPNMGTQRYFLSEPDIVTSEMVAEYNPDHGLLHVHGKVVRKIVTAPVRVHPQHNAVAEAKYLQYALRHLIDNLGSAGVSVNLVEATKMFGKHAVNIAEWKMAQSRAKSAERVA